MDLSPAADWRPPESWERMTVIDAHTGGEPFRIVIDGLPEIPGNTVLDRRRYAMENLDHLRRATMWEPRGHADMYGGWVGPPVEEDSDLSVLFLHNEGFSTMCGHGIIALTTVLLDLGIVASSETHQTLKIDTPAGQITAMAKINDGRVERVGFLNVASFVVATDATVDVETLGEVTYDLAFGGGFYAYVDAASVGVDLSDTSALIEKGRRIKTAVAGTTKISHPEHPDLGFLYGVIFTGAAQDVDNHSRNVCVFADGEIDRSPTGTGVSGRLALLHHRGKIGLGDKVTIESITGSTFEGSVGAETTVAGLPAIIPEITGTAAILGRSEYWFDPDDEIGKGFLLR